MFGSAILDVIIGLMFVYLLLSLICSAINEYIASLLNKRGKMLVNGIQILLRDVDLDRSIFDHPLMASNFPHHGSLVDRASRIQKWPPGLRWLYRLITWAFRSRVREARYPSYVSARAFATAFLEKAGYLEDLLRREEEKRKAAGITQQPPTPPVDSTAAPGSASGPAAPGAGSGAADTRSTIPADATPSGATPTDPEVNRPLRKRGFPGWLRFWERPASKAERDARAEQLANAEKKLGELLTTFRRDAALNTQPFPALMGLTGVAELLPEDEKKKLVDEALAWRNELQSVQTGVEAWFNNGMDRVSGAYKRHTQHMLLAIGLLVAFATNADTVELWRRLSADPNLRQGLATQAAGSLPAVARLMARDSVQRESTTPHTTPAITPPTAPAAGTDSDGAAANDTAVKPVPVTGDTGAKALRDTPQVTLDEAKAVYDSASAMLERTTLNFGWSWEDAQKLGFATRLDSTTAKQLWATRIRADSARIVAETDSTERAGWPQRERAQADKLAGVKAGGRVPRPVFAYAGWRHPNWSSLLAKLLGLLLTTFALSLGAPFWFDMLNKVINIRAAGRAPATTPAPTPAEGAKGDGKSGGK
jgi:hypothetical protein